MCKVPLFYLILQPQALHSFISTWYSCTRRAPAVIQINTQGGTVGSGGGGNQQYLVWGDHFQGGTVHGVTPHPYHSHKVQHLQE